MKARTLPLKVLIADDSIVIRERLSGLLREVPDVCVVGETGDVEGTLEGIRSLDPSVVILDLSMPGGSGLDVLRRMGQEGLEAVVIVLTNFPFPEYKKEAFERGASAFLNKSSEFDRVVELVRAMLNEGALQVHS